MANDFPVFMTVLVKPFLGRTNAYSCFPTTLANHLWLSTFFHMAILGQKVDLTNTDYCLPFRLQH